MKSGYLSSFILLSSLLFSTAEGAELKLLHTTAIKPAIDQLLPGFEARHGDKVSPSYGPAGAIVQRVTSGEAFDVAIATSAQISDLEKQGFVKPDSKRDLAKVGIGVYVRRGGEKPDVSSVERFKEALLKTKSIAFIDPASGGASGIYISGLLQRLGLAEQLKPRLVTPKVVAEVFNSVASGAAELGMGQLSEIVIDPRIELAGMLPAEVQNITLFATGVSAKTSNSEAASALAQFLADPGSQEAFKRFGFERP